MERPLGHRRPRRGARGCRLARETNGEGGIVAEIEGLLGIQNLRQQGWMGIIFLYVGTSTASPPADGGIRNNRSELLTSLWRRWMLLMSILNPRCEWLVRRVLHGEYRIIPPELNNPYQPSLAFFVRCRREAEAILLIREFGDEFSQRNRRPDHACTRAGLTRRVQGGYLCVSSLSGPRALCASQSASG